MLSISGTSRGRADDSTSSLAGSGVLADAIRTGGVGRRSEKAASIIARMETPSTLSSATAAACGVSAAIRARSFSLREPGPTSSAATQPLRTSVPHNTANTAYRCGLITPPPERLVQAHATQAGQESDEAHCRTKVWSRAG